MSAVGSPSMPMPYAVTAVPFVDSMATMMTESKLDEQGTATIEELIELSLDTGVDLQARQMTTELMDYDEGEFYDDVTTGVGAATARSNTWLTPTSSCSSDSGSAHFSSERPRRFGLALFSQWQSGLRQRPSRVPDEMPAKVTPRRLADMLDAGEEFVLLDTRGDESYDSWRVRGAEQFRFGADEELTDDRKAELDDLLDGRDRIVTICAKGVSSDHFAEELSAAGYDDVSVVTGGMEAWSQVYDAVPVETDGPAEIVQVQRRAKGCLGYVVADPETGEAAVVDATRHTAEFRAVADERDWEITRVFDTHVHADHVSGGRDLASALGVPYHLSEAARERDVTDDFTPLGRNEVVEVGDVQLKALRAPGHTTEMVNLLVNREAVLTADTLHVGSVGRTELEFGDEDAAEGARMQHESLHRTILAEPDDLAVLPGHVEVTGDGEFAHGEPGEPVRATIGEARTSYDLLQLDEDAFVDRLTSGDREKPPNFERIIAVNRGAESVEPSEATDMEMGPNNCSA